MSAPTTSGSALADRFRERFRLDAGWFAEVLSAVDSTRGLSPGEVVARTGVPESLLHDLLRTVPEAFERHGAEIRLSSAGRALEAALDQAPQPPISAAERAAAIAALRALRARRPTPDRARDQVPATEETLVRRAELLASSYELRGRDVLLLGDADLTSLALLRLAPQTHLSVVDIDDRVLAFVAERAAAAGGRIATWGADLRVGLPHALRGAFDLVFMDPPYASAGMELFLARAAAALRPGSGRIAFAYGVSAAARERALPVQQAVQEMGLVFEQVHPAFNSYRGARVLGSRSTLYVCAATDGTPRAVAAYEADAKTPVHVYTGGAQRQSTRQTAVAPLDVPGALCEQVLAGGGGRITRVGAPVTLQGRPGPSLPLAALLATPGQAARRELRGAAGVVAHVAPATEQTLLRTVFALVGVPALLAWDESVDVGEPFDPERPCWRLARAAFTHESPGLGAQRYASLLLRPRRLEAAPSATDAPDWVLRRAAGHTGGARSGFAEALIALAREHGRPLSKRDAAGLLSGEWPVPRGRLVELPLFVVDRLVLAAEAAARRIVHD